MTRCLCLPEAAAERSVGLATYLPVTGPATVSTRLMSDIVPFRSRTVKRLLADRPFGTLRFAQGGTGERF